MVNSGWVGAGTVEAPAMFKRNGVYYLLFDRLSCFGPQGSGAVVYTSNHPMGPCKYTRNPTSVLLILLTDYFVICRCRPEQY